MPAFVLAGQLCDPGQCTSSLFPTLLLCGFRMPGAGMGGLPSCLGASSGPHPQVLLSEHLDDAEDKFWSPLCWLHPPPQLIDRTAHSALSSHPGGL